MTSLPNELLGLIFAYLEINHTEYNKTPSAEFINAAIVKLQILARCCRSSRTLRSLAEPLLYQTYIRGWIGASPVPTSEQKVKARHLSLRRFTRTIIQRPDLANRIRHVIIENWNIRPKAVSRYKRDHDQLRALTDCVCQNTADLSVYRDEYFNEDLVRGTDDAEVTLLLTLLNNVVHLVVSLVPINQHAYYPGHVGSLLPHFRTDSVARSSALLGQLKTVTLMHPRGTRMDFAAAIPMYLISNFYRAPVVESIIVKDGVVVDAELNLCWYNSGRSSCVEEVVLDQCFMSDRSSGPVVSAFVKPCSRLRVFKYTVRNLETAVGSLHFRGVQRALLTVMSMLESMYVDIGFATLDFGGTGHAEERGFFAMHCFTSLRELTIGCRGIVVEHGYALLPPAVDRLSIIDPTSDFLEPLLTGIRRLEHNIQKLTFIFSGDIATAAASFDDMPFEEALTGLGIAFDKIDME